MTLLGGMALSVALFKLSSVKHVIAATGGKTRVAQAAYGNSTYGGKAA